MTERFQVMPPLSEEEYAALRADIAERGVIVPVVVDQDGNVIDGHHRWRIAAELGIDCPTEVRQVASDEEAREVALMLNLARRHLSREQKRDLIAGELERDPDASDRSIARRLRCSPSTVGAVRRGEVSNLDTMSRVEQIIYHEAQADALGERADWYRREAARLRAGRQITIPSTVEGTVAELNRLGTEVNALVDQQQELERRIREQS